MDSSWYPVRSARGLKSSVGTAMYEVNITSQVSFSIMDSLIFRLSRAAPLSDSKAAVALRIRLKGELT